MEDWDSRRLLVAGVIAALVVALVSVGVAVWALIRGPEAGQVGPRGAQGARGTQGPQGVQGLQGIQGPVGSMGAMGKQGVQGAKGTPGTLRSSQVVSGALIQTGSNPAVGSVLTTTTSCPAQTAILSGGATVTTTGGLSSNVSLRSSIPVSSSAWRFVAQVTDVLGAGQAMTLKPFVVCAAT
jgi:hypothetical protein